MLANLLPVAIITGKTSPAIREPGGMYSVFVTLYVPWSKKRILLEDAAELSADWIAAVSSVLPSPFAPALRMLWKEETGDEAYCGFDLV